MSGKRRHAATVGGASAASFVPPPDSMPPLDTDSQRSVVVIDSQGVSSLAGSGAQRDMLAKAETNALVADARSSLAEAEAAYKAAEDAVRAAQTLQGARARKLNEARQLLYDLTGGR